MQSNKRQIEGEDQGYGLVDVRTAETLDDEGPVLEDVMQVDPGVESEQSVFSLPLLKVYYRMFLMPLFIYRTFVPVSSDDVMAFSWIWIVF